MGDGYWGIDVSKQSLDVVLLVGHRHPHFSCGNNPKGFAALANWLRQQRVERVHACLEATSTYGEAVAVFLHEAGHRVSMVNPKRIKGFADSCLVRTKTDQVSARVIAELVQALKPERWQPPPPEVRTLPSRVRRVQSLKEMRQQEVNRLETATLPAVVESLRQMVAPCDQAIAATEQLIEEHFHQHPGLKQQRDLLQSIPGMGEVSSAVLLAELPPVEQFRSARQVAAYAGLVPQQRQSGTSVRGRTRLSKAGNARIRAVLYWPALRARVANPLIAPLGRRLRRRGKSTMAIIGAAMRKLLHQVFAVLRSQQPFNPALAGRSS